MKRNDLGDVLERAVRPYNPFPAPTPYKRDIGDIAWFTFMCFLVISVSGLAAYCIVHSTHGA